VWPERRTRGRQRQQQERPPLKTERGNTTISNAVVSQVAGIAAQEVEGVQMGGGTSRAVGGVLDSVRGGSGTTRGVTVEVGEEETAIDLLLAVEYGRSIPQVSEAVRSNVIYKARGCDRTNQPADVLPESERERPAGRRASWRSEISCYLRAIGERRSVGGGDANARSFGRIDRIEGAAVKCLAHGTGDVQHGLPVVLDHLIVTHRFASGDTDPGLAGVLVYHRV
jgi:uncharacterized alkaline shock family protein YloU